MQTEPLFVYGTLRDPAIQVALLGRVVPGTPDRLIGYRRHTHFAPYPVALPEAGQEIEGMLLQVGSEELAKLDHYEGEAYLRLWERLHSGREAWFYCGNPAIFRLQDGTTEE